MVYGKETFMKKLILLLRNKYFRIGILLLIFLFILNRFVSGKRKTGELITYRVRRQDLVISVIEGGSLTPLRSQKIVNQVPGRRNILEVVEEGTRITEEDVKNRKVLIKLDSEDLEEKAKQLRISVENSWASYMEAQQNLEILKKQNESDIKKAELNVKFTKMDLEKYLGGKLADKVIKEREIDYMELIKNPELGGEALKRKRELENKIALAKEEVERAKDRVEWSEKLAKRGYITNSELEADKLSLKQKEVDLEQAKLEYELFLNYDFPKKVEELLSEYTEALSELERVKARCKSKLIQAEANVKSKKATYLMNKNRLKEIEKQIKNCTIIATQPGFVIYATSSRPWRVESPIQPGTTVRQFQELLVLPDLSSMGVEVKIHESSIEKVKPGQKAIIKVDAFPEKIFTGTVKKIALMPDPMLKWLNPDINVYVAQIAFDKSYEFLKPGMSAEVEIIIKKLKNVIAIPVTALIFKGKKIYCNLLQGRRLIMRELKLGESNDVMVEVKEGLKEGDIVVIGQGEIAPSMKEKEFQKKGKFRKEERLKKKKR